MSVDHSTRLPPLRPLELVPIEDGGETVVVLNDRQGIAPEPMVMKASVLPFLQLFDGRHTVLDLQAAFSRAVGQIVASDTVKGFIDQLDQALLLESPRFEGHRRELVNAFRAAPVRAPTHAGSAYPGGSDDLRRLLDERRAEHAADIVPVAAGEIAALIAPHIDYERGARCYARAYGSLACPDGTGAEGREPATPEPADPDVFVLIGTAHMGLDQPFSILRKPFVTPFGALPLDEAVAADLERALGTPSDDDLLVHRHEHSLEVTATYLAYALGGRSIPIVPVLCAIGARELARSGVGGEAARALAERLGDSLARHGRRACVVTGADLAHVGPRFGDREPISDTLLAAVEQADRSALEAAAAGDADAFAAAILGVEDRYRVCGLGAIYTVLKVLELFADRAERAQGRLIDYGQATAPDRSQCVTFAGMVFLR